MLCFVKSYFFITFAVYFVFFVTRVRDMGNIVEFIKKFEKVVVRLFLILLLYAFSACNATKFVPQDKYLLNDVKIKILDTKDVPTEDLMTYVQQTQNTEIFGFWKLQLAIYNTASEDTTKWTSKNARKIGEAPVIFSSDLAAYTREQLERAMNNRGYFQAQVDTVMEIKDRKVNLQYQIMANQPYFIRTYTVDIPHDELAQVALDQRLSLIRDGMQFDADLLNQERQRVASAMRRRGYFYFDQEFIQFEADSTMGHQQIDVKMKLQDYVPVYVDSINYNGKKSVGARSQTSIDSKEDEYLRRIFRKYTIANVHFHIDYDPRRRPDGPQEVSSISHGGYRFTWVGKKRLRDGVLIRNCPIEPGTMYNERIIERAYIKLNHLAPIKYVDISFDSVSTNKLDCHIVLSRGKLNSISAEIEGTYSAGDWGLAAGIGYVNRSLFRGAEEFTIDGRGSYEWRQNGGRAIEAKASAGLKFPSAVAVDLRYDFQNRPEEYTRSIFNAGLNYSLSQPRQGLNHHFRFVDISYVYLPWISDAFRDQFLQSTNILKYSYENHFIVGLGYSGNYTSYRTRFPNRSYWNVYYNIETAGNLLRALAKPCKFQIDAESGNYTFLKTQFAQFAKADLSATYNYILHPKHRLVFHADLGVAIPYGNSQTIPFETRYFAGGANSVRGWSARSLGPGGYQGNGKLIDFNNQSGDVRMNLNVEYRAKVWWIFELAAFVDAGNIWTIFDYETQPYGMFKWNEFYKQIAVAYGFGVRMDFSFFIFRVDLGVKLYDPSRLYDGSNTQWRTMSHGLNWRDDVALHFAIGYPF